jgi:uncharacterized lipoprotein YbaY
MGQFISMADKPQRVLGSRQIRGVSFYPFKMSKVQEGLIDSLQTMIFLFSI